MVAFLLIKVRFNNYYIFSNETLKNYIIYGMNSIFAIKI